MSESKTNNALKRLKAICGHVFTKENKYAQELIATAQRIATPGKGILAADESIGTIGKRFKVLTYSFCHLNLSRLSVLFFDDMYTYP
mmetsp:Transcript_26004/g.41197  ORF Transcript_26004/g.41197 Transcript_26004/m.41197 type:complete len:87 (+) Transcript_26004:104-364(+)